MEARKDVTDRDTDGMSPAGLLVATRFDLIVPNECYDHMQQTLHDMGTTCVQGDTHRLFWSYVSLERSKKK